MIFPIMVREESRRPKSVAVIAAIRDARWAVQDGDYGSADYTTAANLLVSEEGIRLGIWLSESRSKSIDPKTEMKTLIAAYGTLDGVRSCGGMGKRMSIKQKPIFTQNPTYLPNNASAGTPS
jgi:hypothetical protein